MKTKTTMGLLALGVVSLMAIGSPNSADADARSRQKKLDRAGIQSNNGNRAELYNDRAELRRDLAELERDRADLNRLYRSGASRSEIARKREEIRQGIGEIRQDRREIRDDFGLLSGDRWNRDRNYGSSGNSDWWGRDNSGSWNRGNSGSSNRGNTGSWNRGYDRSDRGHWGR